MARTKHTDPDSNEERPPPTEESPTTRSKAKKFRPKVRIEEPPKHTEKSKAKGVLKIRESSQKATAKRKTQESDSSSTQSSHGLTEKVAKAVKLASNITPPAKKPRTGLGKPSQSAASSASKSKEPVSLTTGNLDAGVDMAKFKNDFKNRKWRQAIYVDFDTLKKDPKINLDLSVPMKKFEKWLGIREPFSPEIIRRFYCNMTVDDSLDSEGEVTDSVLNTRVRGIEIQLDMNLLNSFLGSPSVATVPEMTPARAYQILLQTDKPFPGALSFPPSQMCDFYRIIHYIYSRCMINRSSSFSYLTQEDYILLARIISGAELDIGRFIFSEMRDFCLNRTRTTQMPYPHLISFLLKNFGIQPLEGREKEEATAFGLTQLNRMHIALPFDPKKGKLPREDKEKDKGKKAVSEPLTQDTEAQSSAGPGVSSVPSFMGASLQRLFHYEVMEMQKTLLSLMPKLVEEKIREEVRGLEERMTQKVEQIHQEMTTMKTEVLERVDDVKNLLLAYLNNLGPNFTEADLAATSGPSPIPVVASPVRTQPQEPTVPTVPISTSPTVPISVSSLSLLDDDKKGEKEETTQGLLGKAEETKEEDKDTASKPSGTEPEPESTPAALSLPDPESTEPSPSVPTVPASSDPSFPPTS